MNYPDYIYDQFTKRILLWDEDLRSDVYALFIFIQEGLASYDASGNRVYFDGVVALAYSTSSQLQEKSSQPNSSASKWWGNYQTGEPPVQIPEVTYETDPNPEEFALRDAWLASFEASTETPGYKKHIVTACQQVIRMLHDNGFIQKVFGRSIPILIVDGEGIIYYEETITANPQNAIAEFMQASIPEWQKG